MEQRSTRPNLNCSKPNIREKHEGASVMVGNKLLKNFSILIVMALVSTGSKLVGGGEA